MCIYVCVQIEMYLCMYMCVQIARYMYVYNVCVCVCRVSVCCVCVSTYNQAHTDTHAQHTVCLSLFCCSGRCCGVSFIVAEKFLCVDACVYVCVFVCGARVLMIVFVCVCVCVSCV